MLTPGPDVELTAVGDGSYAGLAVMALGGLAVIMARRRLRSLA